MNDDNGFLEGYFYPYPHTQYFLESSNLEPHCFQPDQLWAKMILCAFGNVLAQAWFLYGNDPKVLEQPVVMQSMGTHGCVFLVLQLYTTDLAFEEDFKNLAWVDSNQPLHWHFFCVPVIQKKVVIDHVGPTCSQPETFRKFLALYFHGVLWPKDCPEAWSPRPLSS